MALAVEKPKRRSRWYPGQLAAIMTHATPRKVANAVLAESERLARRTYLHSKPWFYYIDPCNVCNLRCPLCSTGLKTLKRPQGMMSLDDYLVILDKIAPYALTVYLYNWGEPLLNKQIFDMIEATNRRGVSTSMSSNLSLHRPDLAERMVTSGLQYLIVSLDGVTQSVYDTYRVRGKIDLVFENMRAIAEAKQRLNSRTPFIEWQFLVMKHNEHEMAAAQAKFPESGADRLRFRPAGVPMSELGNLELAAQWMPTDKRYLGISPYKLEQDGYYFNESCFYLYRIMTVNPGGGIAPCCIVDDAGGDVGNLLHSSLNDVWNSPKMQASRGLFARHPIAQADTICDGCQIFNRRLDKVQPLVATSLPASTTIPLQSVTRRTDETRDEEHAAW